MILVFQERHDLAEIGHLLPVQRESALQTGTDRARLGIASHRPTIHCLASMLFPGSTVFQKLTHELAGPPSLDVGTTSEVAYMNTTP
jgi:hypothetical protein